MLLCLHHSQVGLFLDPVFCAHWKKGVNSQLMALLIRTFMLTCCYGSKFPKLLVLQAVSLMILGKIFAGPQICPYDSGNGWTRISRELSYDPDFSPCSCKALGGRVSSRGLSVLTCTRAELDWMVPSLPFLSNLALFNFSASDACLESVARLARYLYFRVLLHKAQNTKNSLGRNQDAHGLQFS